MSANDVPVMMHSTTKSCVLMMYIVHYNKHIARLFCLRLVKTKNNKYREMFINSHSYSKELNKLRIKDIDINLSNQSLLLVHIYNISLLNNDRHDGHYTFHLSLCSLSMVKASVIYTDHCLRNAYLSCRHEPLRSYLL